MLYAEPYGSRRTTWLTIRFLLAGMASLVCALTGNASAGLWVVPPLLVVAAGPDLVLWMRSRAGRTRKGPTATH